MATTMSAASVASHTSLSDSIIAATHAKIAASQCTGAGMAGTLAKRDSQPHPCDDGCVGTVGAAHRFGEEITSRPCHVPCPVRGGRSAGERVADPPPSSFMNAGWRIGFGHGRGFISAPAVNTWTGRQPQASPQGDPRPRSGPTTLDKEDKRVGEEGECLASSTRSSDQANTVICAKGPLRRSDQNHTDSRGP